MKSGFDDEEYVERVVVFEVKTLVQVRKGHETTDLLTARARFRKHVEGDTGPANLQREDPGILTSRIIRIKE